MLTFDESRLFHGIHDCGKSAKRDVLIGTNKDELVARIANLLPQLDADFVDVDGDRCPETRAGLC